MLETALVTGSGRVEDGEGRGVEGATVMVDGLSVAVTDALEDGEGRGVEGATVSDAEWAVTDPMGDYSFTFPTSLLSSAPLHHPPSATPIPPPTPPTPPPPSPPLPTTHTISAVRPLYVFPTLSNITLPPAPATATAATDDAKATTNASETEAAALTAISLPPIRATRYALCGRVEMDPGGESSFVPWRRVELSRAGDFDGSHMDGSQDPSWGALSSSMRSGGISRGSSSMSSGGISRGSSSRSSGSSSSNKGLRRQEASTSVAPVIAEADKDGRFCFMVPRGSYQLVPEISPDEVASGLIFSPSIEESVTVTSAPVTNIVFKQSHLFISGKVRCLQGCDSTVSVTLWALTDNGADERADGETEQQQGTFLQRVVVGGGEGEAGGKAEGQWGKAKGRRKVNERGEGKGRSAVVVEEKGTVGSFFFDRLLPGSYRIEVSGACECVIDWRGVFHRGDQRGRGREVVAGQSREGHSIRGRSFFFDRLLPGSYRIEADAAPSNNATACWEEYARQQNAPIPHFVPPPTPPFPSTQKARKTPATATALQSGEWCWEEEGRTDVAVFDSPVTNVQLAQRGWRMVVRAAMDDRFTLTHGEYDPTDFSVSGETGSMVVRAAMEDRFTSNHGDYDPTDLSVSVAMEDRFTLTHGDYDPADFSVSNDNKVVRAAMDDRFMLTHGDYDPTGFFVSPGVQEFCVELRGEYTLAMSQSPLNLPYPLSPLSTLLHPTPPFSTALQPGVQEFCVESPGEYTLAMSHACATLAMSHACAYYGALSFSFHTHGLLPVLLTPTAYCLSS
ncbi:unnamed protein product [Closterium sp. NIES-65]|nr:unnamed protein product [Closterium sp. NIES-65]